MGVGVDFAALVWCGFLSVFWPGVSKAEIIFPEGIKKFEQIPPAFVPSASSG